MKIFITTQVTIKLYIVKSVTFLTSTLHEIGEKQITWKCLVRLIEKIRMTFSTESKASFSLASLLLWVAQTPCCTDNSRFSRLQLLTIKYLIPFKKLDKCPSKNRDMDCNCPFLFSSIIKGHMDRVEGR